MSADENVAIARRFFAEQDRRNGPLAPELCAPDYIARIPGFASMDRASHTQFATAFYAAFPDLTQTVDDAFADAAKAALRFTITGTHRGELMGEAPSGKPITVAGIALLDIVGGTVAALDEIFDQLGLMQQIEAIPTPGQATPEAGAEPRPPIASTRTVAVVD